MRKKSTIHWWGIPKAVFLKSGASMVCAECDETFTAKVVWLCGHYAEGPDEDDTIVGPCCLDDLHKKLNGRQYEINAPKGMSPKVALKTITKIPGFYRHLLAMTV